MILLLNFELKKISSAQKIALASSTVSWTATQRQCNLLSSYQWATPSVSLLHNGYRVFPGGKERPGRDADPSPPPSAVVKKG